MRKFDSLASIKKKINQYSYLQNESIGKGYSSCVYKGSNDLTGRCIHKCRLISGHQAHRYEECQR